MNNNQQDMEVTFNDVVIAAVRSWRVLLAACLAAAVLLGGVQGLLTLKTVGGVSAETVAQNNLEHQQAYDREIAAQNDLIARLQKNIESQQAYLDGSVLMHMDPQDCWTAKVSYFVDNQMTPDQTVDPINTLLTGYQAELTSGHVIGAAAEAVGMESQYLKELLRVSADTKSASSNRLLTVAVCHPDADMAQAILEAMKEQILLSSQTLANQVAPHRLSEVSHSLIKENDIGGMVERQNEEFGKLRTMEADIAAAQEAIEKAELVVEPLPSRRDALGAALQGAGIGAVLGLALAAVFVSVRYLLSDKVCCGADLTRRTGVRLLGSIEKEDRTYKKLDRWAMNRQGRPLLPREDSFRLAAADIDGYSQGLNRILVCGDVPEQSLEQLCSALEKKLPQLQLVAGRGDLLQDIATAEALRSCDGVILLAHAGTSRCSVVRRQAAKLESLHKVLLGCVVLEK